MKGKELKIMDYGVRVQRLGFRVKGLGFRVLGFRVQGLGERGSSGELSCAMTTATRPFKRSGRKGAER